MTCVEKTNLEDGRIHFTVKDRRGCVEELYIQPESIGTWDIEVNLIRPPTPYSPAKIEVSIPGADGTLAPYKLEIEGVVYDLDNPLGVSTLSIPLRSGGVHDVTVFNTEDCEITKEVDFQSCAELPRELLISYQIDYSQSDDKGPEAPNLYHQCTDDAQLVLNIFGGLGPYLVEIRSSDPNTPWSFSATYDESIDDGIRIPQNLPDVDVTVQVVDDCGSIVLEDVRFCNGCDFTYDNSGVRKFLIGRNGGVVLEVDCPCGNCGTFSDSDVIITFNPALIQDWELPYTIIWPASAGQVNTVIDYNQNGEIAIVHGTDDVDFVSSTAGSVPIVVQRGDGCELTIPVAFHEAPEITLNYFTGGSGVIEAYEGTFTCAICAATDDPNLISQDDCEGDSRLFVYIPDDLQNPCNGGGTLIYYTNEEGSDELSIAETVVFGRDEAIGAIFEHGMFNVNPNCVVGGTCFFPSDRIEGISDNSYPIAAFWCGEAGDPNADPCDEAPPCPEGFECYLGECEERCELNMCEDACDFFFEMNGENRNETFLLEHGLEDGSLVELIYNSFVVPDHFRVTGVYNNWNSGCVATRSDRVKRFQVKENVPIKIEVKTDCSRLDTRWFIELTCINGGTNAGN